jgi:cyclic pyranopterin phosphate synthase
MRYTSLGHAPDQRVNDLIVAGTLTAAPLVKPRPPQCSKVAGYTSVQEELRTHAAVAPGKSPFFNGRSHIRRGMNIVERQFSHINATGKLRMVDVTSKRVTKRVAKAHCLVVTLVDFGALDEREDGLDAILCARIAGVSAAKKTADLIPLCHTLPLNDVDVELSFHDRGVEVTATVTATQRTGVEMEALTACAFAALSLLDALRDADPMASIDELEVLKKEGGKSGNWGRLVDDADEKPKH